MVSPCAARALCCRDDIESSLAELRREGLDATDLRHLLDAPEQHSWTARPEVVELFDEHGASTTAAVHVPSPAQHARLGVLVVLHGAGGSGEQVLPYFRALGDSVGMAVVCPTAQPVAPASNNLDLAGIFGKRFGRPSWDLRGGGFPLAALRWARTVLGVDPDRCVLAGVSMGGLATWNVGMRFWHMFAAAVPVNGALSMWESFGQDRRTRALLPNALPLPLFVVHGGRDEQIPPRFDRESVATLRGLGHESLEYAEIADGGHALRTLRMDQGGPLFDRLKWWLSSRCRRRQPVQIRHRAEADRHGRAHWVAISGIRPHQTAQVHAHRREPGRIVVEVEHAEQVTLHLTSDWLAPGDPVVVSVNGVCSPVVFEPDVETVVRSYRTTADPALVAEQIVSLPVPVSAGNTPSDTPAGVDRAHPI